MKRRLSEDTVWSVVGYVFLIAMLAITLFPWFIAGITSLKTHDQIYVMPPTWLPTAPRLVNYIEIFQVMPFARAFLNSTIVAVGSALLALMAALPAGYALSRFEFPGRRVFLFIVLGSIMFSPVVVIVALFRIMTVYNLIDKYWSLILTNATFSLSFCIWLSTAYMRRQPPPGLEACGASCRTARDRNGDHLRVHPGVERVPAGQYLHEHEPDEAAAGGDLQLRGLSRNGVAVHDRGSDLGYDPGDPALLCRAAMDHRRPHARSGQVVSAVRGTGQR
jgi:hypothetical protein